MFEQIFGPELGLPARAVVALVLVLALIALTVWLMRRFGDSRIASQAGGRGRQQRLAVLDSTSVDARRKLVLIRRDNVEHLILIGGPTDVVIEPNIVRAQPASGGVRPAARPGGYEDEDTSLIPDTPGEPERPVSGPSPAPAAARAGQPSEPPRTMPRPAQKLDPQYADMAQRLEAALRKPAAEPEATRPAPAPRPAPPVQDSRVEPKPTAPAPAPRAPMPRIPESRPEPRVEAPRPQAAPQVTPPPATSRQPRRNPHRPHPPIRPRPTCSRVSKKKWPVSCGPAEGKTHKNDAKKFRAAMYGRRASCESPGGVVRRRAFCRGICAGHLDQLRQRGNRRRRRDRARDPADRHHHGPVARARDPRHGDVVHAHRRGAVAPAHRDRPADRAAQCRDHFAGAFSHRLRHGAGVSDRL
jgi:flagellar protein FliO/FliZ